jgi:hypothetical protein
VLFAILVDHPPRRLTELHSCLKLQFIYQTPLLLWDYLGAGYWTLARFLDCNLLKIFLTNRSRLSFMIQCYYSWSKMGTEAVCLMGLPHSKYRKHARKHYSHSNLIASLVLTTYFYPIINYAKFYLSSKTFIFDSTSIIFDCLETAQLKSSRYPAK